MQPAGTAQPVPLSLSEPGGAAAERRLLHISDVHFGPPHRPDLAEKVLAFAERWRPDAVVLSGDLTQRAKPHQFQQARRFVDRLPAPTLVVPGNHDVPLYRFWERTLAPFRAYRRHFAAELEPVWSDEQLLLVGINTAHGWTLKEGRVPLSRIREVVALIESAPPHVFKVVVAHHHLTPPPRFGTQTVASNAFEAIASFSAAGVDMILSGHQHQTYVATSEEFYPSGRAPVIILHAGTSTSSRGRGSEVDKNTFNCIRVDQRSLHVSHYHWEPTLAEFVEISRHWYPRRHCSPYRLPQG
jgi:3',5'-cyclic AMP phosphodiesterase CpdA